MNVNKVILTYEDLYNQFRKAGVKAGQHIMVHTSLSSLGFVVGGPETVIRVLIDLVGSKGTIMMPTQTWKNLDPSTGVHWEEPEEWWQIIRDNWPAYDKNVTPAISMGCVARMFCVWPGVERSDHPARSVAAYGREAKWLTANHDFSNIFGIGSPIHKLYKLDGYILLIGVGYDKNTSIHLGEVTAEFSSKKFTTEHSAVFVEGRRKWIAYETEDVQDYDFVELGENYDKEAHIQVHKIGNAEVRIFKQNSFVDFAKSWFEEHRQ